MNKYEETPGIDDALQRKLDLLVDGELAGEEYQALLRSLDQEPEGWRRCALAFLEAQAITNIASGWKREAWAKSEAGGSAAIASGGAKLPARQAHPWNWPACLAIAASFVIAFGLGTAYHQFFSPPKPEQEAVAAGNHSSLPVAAPVSNRHEVLRPLGDVRLVVDGPEGEQTDAGQVPLFEAEPGFEPFLRSDRPALAPELVELLREAGHDVVRQEQYLPGVLEDGREVIVPVERYQITPVSRAY